MRQEIREAYSHVATALSEGFPVVLVAGECLDRRSISQGRVLDQVRHRFGLRDGAQWTEIFCRTWTSEDLSWLTERFERAVPSEELIAIADFPWSAVFSASPDPKLARLLSSRGRQPEVVLSSETIARVSRSRSRPPVYFLYGKSDETQSSWVAPKSRAEFMRRTQLHVSELLNRISETATPRGVVVIGGVATGSWLDLESLLASLASEAGPMILYFGGETLTTPIADDLRSAGRLLEMSEGVGDLIQEFLSGPDVDTLVINSPGDPGTVTTAVKPINVTAAMRLRVEASSSIVDDEWTIVPPPLKADDLSEAFRRFHGGIGGPRELVTGVGRGFAIKRTFEERLRRSLVTNLERLSQVDGTLVVYGQSGTGKSVALARLARDIRETMRLPVLFSTSRLPTFADVEGFCDEVERAGVEATVLICDANLPASRYRDLAAGLRSRGRRVVVVGTSYESEDYDPDDLLNYVNAPATILSSEAGDLAALLSQFDPTACDRVEWSTQTNFLALLYRALSIGREKLTSGLSGEARHWERELRSRGRRTPRTRALSNLAQQLVDLGLADKEFAILEDEPSAEPLGLDSAAKLVDYVMVAGRLNCPIPLNLVIRALNRDQAALELNQIAFLFSDLDIFRWKTPGDEGADLLLSPRLQFEADLICRRRIADSDREISLLVELISAARPSGVESNTERAFLLDLLQKLDRDGPRGDAYRSGYLRFADALTDLRTRRGMLDASLMLRESVFRRQAVWSLDGSSKDHEQLTDRLPILEAARSTVEDAIGLIDAGQVKASRRTRLNLLSERASIYGYLAVQRFKADDAEGSWSDYLAARVASSRAMALSDDYHPADISLWTSSDMLRSEKLSPEKKAEIVAELYATMDLVDSGSLSDSQRARFLERKARAASAIGDVSLEAESLKALEAVAPETAAFLVARTSAPFLADREEITSADQSTAAHVAQGLVKRIEQASIEDVKCQRLLLQLSWIASTGTRLLHGERGATPAQPGEVRELLDIVRRLNEIAGVCVRNQERFLEAVLSWIAGDHAGANEIWRVLSRDSEYEDRSRIRRRLILSDSNGSPIRVSGRVESGAADRTWRVRISGFGVTIPMSNHEFTSQDLAIGREVRDFGVAFNYVGPVADPLVHTGKRR